MLHLITCHGRIMPCLVELLFCVFYKLRSDSVKISNSVKYVMYKIYNLDA